jgi:hypothetical protein
MKREVWNSLKKRRYILDEWIEDEDAMQLTWAVQKFVSGYLGH